MNDQELYQLIVGVSDIGAAQATAEYATSVVKDIRSRLWFPLLEATVVSYARPFTTNRPYGPLPKRWGRFSNASQQKLHDELIDIRNQTIAHSDAAVRKVLIYPPGTPLAPSMDIATTSNFGISTQRLPPSRFTEIEKHCLYLGTRMYQEISAEMQKFDSRPGFAFDLLTGDRVDGDPEENVTEFTPGK